MFTSVGAVGHMSVTLDEFTALFSLCDTHTHTVHLCCRSEVIHFFETQIRFKIFKRSYRCVSGSVCFVLFASVLWAERLIQTVWIQLGSGAPRSLAASGYEENNFTAINFASVVFVFLLALWWTCQFVDIKLSSCVRTATLCSLHCKNKADCHHVRAASGLTGFISSPHPCSRWTSVKHSFYIPVQSARTHTHTRFCKISCAYFTWNSLRLK